ncbi:hypothetical protein GCM10027517_09010 [Phycicoccus ginsengisoli]
MGRLAVDGLELPAQVPRRQVRLPCQGTHAERLGEVAVDADPDPAQACQVAQALGRGRCERHPGIVARPATVTVEMSASAPRRPACRSGRSSPGHGPVSWATVTAGGAAGGGQSGDRRGYAVVPGAGAPPLDEAWAPVQAVSETAAASSAAGRDGPRGAWPRRTDVPHAGCVTVRERGRRHGVGRPLERP